VIYQIYPRSFFDSNGDGIGDLAGIADKLDYIAGLGVDAVWISPFFASPMQDFGYDVADYRAVDPVFGTLEDFDRLVVRAHALGLKVLIDQIWGHSSDRHPWFLDSRASHDAGHADWYVWADPKPDGMAPNNWLSVFGGSAWQWEPRRRQFYLHHFLASQPTLNLRNEAVVAELLDIGAFWLEHGVDGFRLDAVDFFLHDPELRDNPAQSPPDGKVPAKLFGLQQHVHDMLHSDIATILRRIRGLMDRYLGRTTLAEVSSQAGAFERVGSYTAGDDQLHMAYTLQPSRGQFDRAAVQRLLNGAASRRGWAAWSFSNHDVERAVSRWAPDADASVDPDFARLLMGLLLTLRGSVSVYQGEELALPAATVAPEDMQDPFGIAFYPEYSGRDGSRTPMPWLAGAPQAGFTSGTPWLPIDPRHIGLSVDRQESDCASMLHAWRRFLAWRKSHPALIDGELGPVAAPEPLIAFRRKTPEESIRVVLNLTGDAVPLPESLTAGTRALAGHGFAEPKLEGIAILPRYGLWFATEEGDAAARERALAPSGATAN
jgi:alpha-glucosidase